MAERTESSIRILADAATIFDVIADLPAYPQWSQGISEVEVLESADGRPVRARFTLDAGIIKDVYELAYTWNGLDSVSWSLVKAEVLTAMDGAYECTIAPDGSAHLSYQLTVDLRIPMLGMLKRKAEQVIVDTALAGLKKRVESNGSHTR
ncbi:MAG: SRPBCC family protein [Actinomycetota bacterium]|nr:SRPBCC family protein [Actinomycetota bacterium]